MLDTWFYEHLYFTDGDILLFLFHMTNVLSVSRFGQKRLRNALNVNVNVVSPLSHRPIGTLEAVMHPPDFLPVLRDLGHVEDATLLRRLGGGGGDDNTL